MRLPLTPRVWRPIYWVGAALPGALIVTGVRWGWPGLLAPVTFIGPAVSLLAAASGAGSKAMRILRIVLLPLAITAFFLVGMAILSRGQGDWVLIND